MTEFTDFNIDDAITAANEDKSKRDLLPNGDYVVLIERCDIADKPSGSRMLEFKLKVTEGPLMNRVCFINECWTSKPKLDGGGNIIEQGKSQPQTHGLLAHLCKALNVTKLPEPMSLCGRRVKAKLGIEKGKGAYEGRDNNKVLVWAPATSAPPAAAPPAAESAKTEVAVDPAAAW